MVLSDYDIEQRCTEKPPKQFTGKFHDGDPSAPIFTRGEVPIPMIQPYNPDQLEPASYDVQLGNDFRIFQRDDTPFIDLADPHDITKHVHIPDDGYFLMHPGEFVLGVTRERVNMPNDLVARIEGKSSVGRLGLMIHVTAGYIDPGFSGCVTLEMYCLHPLPVKLRPGKLIAQLSFHQMLRPANKPYSGRYQGDTTVTASRYAQSHKQFTPEYESMTCVPHGVYMCPTCTKTLEG